MTQKKECVYDDFLCVRHWVALNRPCILGRDKNYGYHFKIFIFKSSTNEDFESKAGHFIFYFILIFSKFYLFFNTTTTL